MRNTPQNEGDRTFSPILSIAAVAIPNVARASLPRKYSTVSFLDSPRSEAYERLSLWAERKWERYDFGPDHPSLMFWLLTAIFLLHCVLVVQVIVDYYPLLRRTATVLSMLILYPLAWTVNVGCTD